VLARTERVEVRLAGRMSETLEALVRREVPAASNRPPNAALTVMGGGPVPIDPRDANTPTALQGWFQLELELPATRIHALGERVYARFDHGWEPLAWRIYRSARQLFMKRFTV
jgi:putative peptide zinc metalloprotease protein